MSIISLIRGFLTRRSLRVRVGNHTSSTVDMQAGTPQGAVLSPTLFNTYMDDLIAAIGSQNGIEIAQYADDIALWTADKCPRRAEIKINKALESLSKWTSDWRIKMAPEKSVFLLFTRRPTHRRMTINIQINGQQIKRMDNHRFLGVKFEDKLDWGKHINEMIGSATSRINALKRLSAKSLWKYPDWLIKIHEMLFMIS